MKKLLTEFGWIALAIFIVTALILGSNNSIKSASSKVMNDNLSYQKNYP
jgi:preprotein translocase subunit SecG